MGQRTQVLQVIKTDLPQLGDNQLVSVQFLHNQWGFGKVMPLLLISQLSKSYSLDPVVYGDKSEAVSEIQKSFQSICANLNISTDRTSDYSDVFWHESADDIAREKKAIDHILNATYAELPDVINQYGDNNDGYMVMVFTLALTPDKQYDRNLSLNVEVAFITRGVKGKAKYLTANQYMKQWADKEDRYAMKPTMKALDSLASLFDDDWQNTPNQWANLPKHLDADTLASLKPFQTYAPDQVVTDNQ